MSPTSKQTPSKRRAPKRRAPARPTSATKSVSKTRAKAPVRKPRPSRARSGVAPVPLMARTLKQLEDDPTSPELVTQARNDINQYGLDAFFSAAQKTSTGKQAMKVEAAQQNLRAAVVPQVEQQERAFGFPAAADDAGGRRRTWKDCIASRMVQPLRVYRPTTLESLRSILRQAADSGCKVKAVGSGHSFTDVASTTDFLVETHGLNHPLPLETGVLKADAEPQTLFETEGGITVKDLNEALWEQNLGLTNMGGYDGQTIMGVISTSTHGSGVAFGPLTDFVVSMTTVLAHGRTVRIEPADGITEPARWAAAHPDIELVQDDDVFNACRVGIGCMGVVYAVVLRVSPSYFLLEERRLTTWRELKAELQSGDVLLQHRHYEILVNPYKINGDHTCLITQRSPVQSPLGAPTGLGSVAPPSHRNILTELFASAKFIPSLLMQTINHFPTLVPQILNGALTQLQGDYADRSYRVFNIGAANDLPAYGSEIGFPMRTYLDATERILQIAEQAMTVGSTYLTSPFSLRFCKASTAYLSMMHDADTCMIEFPMLDQTIGGRELLHRIETEMYHFGGRPHWGLLNFLTGNHGFIEQMYPMFGRWLAVWKQLDPDAVFSNAFTERCGISAIAFER